MGATVTYLERSSLILLTVYSHMQAICKVGKSRKLQSSESLAKLRQQR